MDSFELLNDGDLKELGFVMGHRKMLLAWIARQQAQKDEANAQCLSLTCTASPCASRAASPLSDAPGSGNTSQPSYRRDTPLPLYRRGNAPQPSYRAVSQDTRNPVCFKVMCSEVKVKVGCLL